MQKCENCNEQFSWSEIYKSYWWTYKPIKCKQCEAVHKITITGRITFVSFTIVPFLIFGYFLSPFSNIFVTLGVGIIILIFGSLWIPFFVKYKEAR